MHPLLGWQQLFLEVMLKPHLRPNGCVAPLMWDSHLIL